MKEVIFNLSQRGGSHLRPLVAFLNREFPQGDFKAKSGNICLKLSTLLTWLNNEIKTVSDFQKNWDGTNLHNQVGVCELIPIGWERVAGKWQPKKIEKTSILCGLVWDADKEAVQGAMDALADFLIKKVSKDGI